MYQAHFGLKTEPFSIAPDPSFLFLSDSHNEALAHLMYGFSHGGFVLITGEVGTGKTTLLRNLLDRTPPDLDVAFILNPRLTVRELLASICDELGVQYGDKELDSVKQYIDALNKHLLQTHQTGRSTVVIIDEAQNLSPAVLEQIRLLTNLETNDKKLLRIILLGQPELADMLDRTELRQLAQRITARYHLTSLSKSDVHAYVGHRLTRAGGNPGTFTKAALNTLYRLSKGTPRLINVIADRAMLGAYVEGEYQVTPKLIRRGADEVFGSQRSNYKKYLSLAAGVALIAGLLGFWAYQTSPSIAPDEPASQAENSAQLSSAEPTDADSPTSKPAGSEASPATLTSPPNAPTRAPARAPTKDPTLTKQPTPTITNATDTPPGFITIGPPPQKEQARVRLPTQTIANENFDTENVTTADLARPPGRTFTNQRRAYRAVFGAWGADYLTDSNQIPCNFAPRVGLQCLSRNGSWTEIASLNLPVVLELWDDQSTPYYAALIESDGGRYQIQIGDRTVNTTPRDLRDHWFGTYVVLWQTPPDYIGNLQQGDNHSTIRWLYERLSELRPDAQLGKPQTLFDAALSEAIIDFQEEEGLLADGIVGPLTWIRLSDRLNLPAPKLQN